MGGSFDPVHIAHLRLATEAMEGLKLEKVRWIPSGAPGHRAEPQANTTQRHEMLRLACAPESRFEIDAAELTLTEPTYTINTLKRLRAELGDSQPLVMLIGMDSLLGLHTLREWRSVFDLAHFGVAQRPGYELKIEALDPSLQVMYEERVGDAAVLNRPHGHIVHFDSLAFPLSSSEIRARLGAGKSVRYLLPDPVFEFIDREGLYR